MAKMRMPAQNEKRWIPWTSELDLSVLAETMDHANSTKFDVVCLDESLGVRHARATGADCFLRDDITMHHLRRIVMGLLLATGMPFVLIAHAENAAPNDAASLVAMSSDAGDSDVDAGTDADAIMGPQDPTFPAYDHEPFPEEKSPRPSKEEWEKAPIVDLAEGSIINMQSDCKAQRLREWIRLACIDTPNVMLTLLSGNADDVFLELGPLELDRGSFPRAAEVVFAVRKGDRRLIEWQAVRFHYGMSMEAVSAFLISEMWLPGDEKPVIYAR